MKNLLFLILFLFGSFTLFSQSPQSFKYQGVARNGASVVTGNVGLQLTIRSNAADGTAVYREQHFPTTSNTGVFSVNVGEGTAITGNLQNIDWGNGTYFLQAELDPSGGANFTDLGASQILSVPFALFAEKAGYVEGDTDGDPSNEIQQFSVSGNQLTLSNGGNTVTLPTGSGTTYSAGAGIGITGNIISNMGDSDNSPTNELQQLSVSGNQLSLSNGNSVTLPTGTTYTAGSGIGIAGNIITATDNSATNELQLVEPER
ncbi:MAG: hypothetical protein IPM82_01095 [Saprospiraceae bacterium]|nr:hypothetical protein [Saprospiraceae bacterium]